MPHPYFMEREGEGLRAERAAEQFQERWNETYEGAEADAENLLDYVQRLTVCDHHSEEWIDGARGAMKLLAVSLDALERLAR